MGAKRKHVGDEQIKKGYVRIKVAEPNVWKQKQVYIYEKEKGVEIDRNKEVVIFLDGDNRNFAIENLYLLPRKYIARLNNLRSKNDTSKIVLQKIELVKMQITMNEVAEKVGMATICKKGNSKYRRLKSKANEYARLYKARMSPEQRKEVNHRHYMSYKKKMSFLKENDIEKYNELIEKKREYSRIYARKMRNEKQNSRCK